MNNLYDAKPDKVRVMEAKINEIVNRVDEREKRTEEGRLGC